MLTSRYIEDIFLSFADLVYQNLIPAQPHDVSVIVNFSNVISSDKGLTVNQGNFIIKLLQKYKNFSIIQGLDYTEDLKNPNWKEKFRVLDLSKKLYVQQDSEKNIWICAKFPYQLKKEFDMEFGNEGKHWHWDHEEKTRKNRLYDTNLISLFEFAQQHVFDIDESYMSALSQVEEIWQHQDQLLPHCVKINNKVTLVNAVEDAQTYFDNNKTENVSTDLLLAKSMGFPFLGSFKTHIEKIAASSENFFWLKSYEDYFNLINDIDGKIVILLDRSEDRLGWLKNFSQKIDEFQFPRNQVKVCFREEKGDTSNLNLWIKENNFGGKVDEGKILIFHQKPAKWLFKDLENVKIVTTTSLFPSPNPIVRDFCDSHSCVIYLGDIKPSEKKDRNIVKL